MARLQGLGREGQDMVTTYAVRHWHEVEGKDVHLDFLLNANSPEEAACTIAATFGDKVTRVRGSFHDLYVPVLFCLGCNSEVGPDTASVEVYSPTQLPSNWAPAYGQPST